MLNKNKVHAARIHSSLVAENIIYFNFQITNGLVNTVFDLVVVDVNLDDWLTQFTKAIFFGFAIQDPLNLQHARAMRILYCALDEIPHSLAFFSIYSLLDVPHAIVLLLCLCVDETVTQMYLPEPFCLISELCFSNPTVSESVF